VLYSPQSVRAVGQPYSLTSFGLWGGIFERLGNVYGCEGLDINYHILLFFEIPENLQTDVL
jgi:hypothetical protein